MTDSKNTTSRDLLGPLRPGGEDLVYVDGLTGLCNQRLLAELLDKRFDELVSLADSFALVMIDLDLFKEVNDRYGHLSGDEVLRTTGELLRNTFRESDLIFRYGGDEFLVLLPGASAAEAEALGRRARNVMQTHEFFDPDEKEKIDVPLSFSVGIVAYPEDGASGRQVLASADERLYAEKKIHLASRRRKRVLAMGSVILIAVMLFAVAIVVIVERERELSRPLILVEPSPMMPDPVAAEERDLLMREIEDLERQIELLRAARPQAPPTDPTSPELTALERKVTELTEQLKRRDEAEKVEKVEETPEPVVALPKPPPAEPVRKPPPPVRSEQPPPSKPVVIPPRLKTRVTPVYPPFARERDVEATVNIEVLVDATGSVREARVVSKPVGFGLEEAARQAALDSEWLPATRDGTPIPMRTTLQVRFQISR